MKKKAINRLLAQSTVIPCLKTCGLMYTKLADHLINAYFNTIALIAIPPKKVDKTHG